MFEDDPLANDFDNHGTVYRPETQVYAVTQLALVSKSGNGSDNLWGYEEREARKELRASASYLLNVRPCLALA